MGELLWSGSAIVLANWSEHVDHSARGEGRTAVLHPSGNQRNHPWLEDRRLVANRELKLAFDHVRQLLVRMIVHRHDTVRVQQNFSDRHRGGMRVVASNRSVENSANGDVRESRERVRRDLRCRHWNRSRFWDIGSAPVWCRGYACGKVDLVTAPPLSIPSRLRIGKR